MDACAEPRARAQTQGGRSGEAGLIGGPGRGAPLGSGGGAALIGAPTNRALAPAKVNLFLHVGGVRPDGYHPVASWMVFADVGDTLELTPADQWAIEVEGKMAAGIGPGENLVARAARLLFERAGVAPLPLKLRLDKTLPVAAGLGGGSSDAGAALRLLNARLPHPLMTAELESVAAELGADGAACLHAAPVIATGVGERLAPAPVTPPLPAVLVNPRRPSPTGAVYRAYDDQEPANPDAPDLSPRFSTPALVAEALALTRNDLEGPAVSLEPEIGGVLDSLSGHPETLLARMSGSGGTCFALCADRTAADTLARRLTEAHPRWWVRSCMLNSQPDGPLTKS